MESKDPRTAFTQAMIKDALLELTKDDDLSRITVNRICEKAGVNRSTFYRYYPGVYELWDSIEDDFFRKIIRELGEKSSDRSNSNLYNLLNVIKENPVLNRTISAHVNSKLSNMIIGYYKDKIIEFWKIEQPDYSQKHLEYMFEAYVGALGAVIRKWVDDGMKDSYDDLALVMNELSFLGLYK